MSLNSFSNSINWLLIIGSRSTLILTCCMFSSKPKSILVNCSSSMIVHLAMQRFWTLIWTSVLSISISPISSLINNYGKCCWKISKGIVILIGHTCIDLTSILNETSGLDIGSIGLITCSTKFKHVEVINIICWFDQTNVGTTMVPIENSLSIVVNIKVSPSCAPSFLITCMVLNILFPCIVIMLFP
jgi:hypothetical protein